AVVDAIDAAADVLLPAAEARRLLRDPPDDVPQRPAALQLLARHARDALRRVDERLRRVGQAAAVEALLRDGRRQARRPLGQHVGGVDDAARRARLLVDRAQHRLHFLLRGARALADLAQRVAGVERDLEPLGDGLDPGRHRLGGALALLAHAGD